MMANDNDKGSDDTTPLMSQGRPTRKNEKSSILSKIIGFLTPPFHPKGEDLDGVRDILKHSPRYSKILSESEKSSPDERNLKSVEIVGKNYLGFCEVLTVINSSDRYEVALKAMVKQGVDLTSYDLPENFDEFKENAIGLRDKFLKYFKDNGIKLPRQNDKCKQL